MFPARPALFALALWCVLGASGAAQDGGAGIGIVHGAVADEEGRPVAGAQVVVRPLGGGDGHTVQTAADGTWIRQNVPAGLHAVTAGSGERHSDLFRVRVRAGRTVEVNLQLAAGRRDGAWLAELGDREASSRAFAFGLAASRAADHATAIGHFERAVERQPECAECNYNLAVSYSNLERFADAEAAFRRVLGIAPDYAAAWYGLASVYARQGRPDDAAEARGEATRLALARLEQRRRQFQEALEQAVARLNAGDIAGARTAFADLLRQDASFAPAHYWLGVSLLRSNDPERAAAALQRYLRIDGSGEYAAQARAELARLER